MGRPSVNLLLINYEYPPLGGGAANATFNIGKCLVGQGHRVTVLTAAFSAKRGRADENGVRVIRIPCRRLRVDRSNIAEMLTFALSAAFRLPSLLKKDRYDGAIVFFALPCGPLGLLGRIAARVPYVISLRGGDVPGSDPAMKPWHDMLSPLRRLVYRRSLAVVANSEALKQQAEAADRHPVRVIPNGVDTDFFTPGPGPATGEMSRILFVGRLQAQKNLFYLFDKIARLGRETAVPFELHLLGDGPDREKLERRAHELDIADRLVWHGWVSDREAVRSLYRSATFLVNPSLGEGMPNCVLEAMACGVPALASRVPGNDAVVKNGETGLLFDLKAPNEFAASMRDLLENREWTRTWGRNARRGVLESHGWNAGAKAYALFFEKNNDSMA